MTDKDYIPDFINLYKQVLRKFPFSITGIADRDKMVSDYFNELSKHSFFNNKQYTFLMGGFLKLIDEQHLKLKKWNPAPFSSLFYKSYTDSEEKSELLSFYYYCINKYHGELNTSFVLSQGIISDIDFKVTIDDSISLPDIKFHQENRVLKVLLPKNFINKNLLDKSLIEFHRYFKSFFHKEIGLLADEMSLNYFLIRHSRDIDKSSTKSYLELYNKLFHTEAWSQYKSELIKKIGKFKHRKYHIFHEKIFNDEIWLDYFSNACLSLGFLCYYYDSSVEYLLSVANIEDKKNDLSYFRNLGGLIIGYPNDREISESERVYLNVISDFITANVATDYLNKKVSRFEVVQNWTNIAFVNEYLITVDSNKWNGFINDISNKANEIIKHILKELEPIDKNIQEFIDNGNKIHTYSELRFNSKDLKSFLIARRVILGLFKNKDQIQKAFPSSTFDILVMINRIFSSRGRGRNSRANNLAQAFQLKEKDFEITYRTMFCPEELSWFDSL